MGGVGAMTKMPAPLGPGLGLADPSVKMIVDVVGRDTGKHVSPLGLVDSSPPLVDFSPLVSFCDSTYLFY